MKVGLHNLRLTDTESSKRMMPSSSEFISRATCGSKLPHQRGELKVAENELSVVKTRLFDAQLREEKMRRS